MSSTPIPVLVESPHGGSFVPPEVDGHLRVHRRVLEEDADTGVRALIAGMGDVGAHVFEFAFWRAILDANRELSDFSDDGIVKTKSSKGHQLYHLQGGLPRDVAIRIIQTYVVPYYREIINMVTRRKVKAVFSTHTMTALPPNVSRFDATHAGLNEPRPLFVLLNHGDTDGNPDQDQLFPLDGMKYVRDIITGAIGKLNIANVKFDRNNPVAFNKPFGSYNATTRLGGRQNVPGAGFLLMEVNQDLIPNNLRVLQALTERIAKEIAAHICPS